jgi:hypothetical protein
MIRILKRRKITDSVLTEELLQRIKEVVLLLEKDRTGLKKILIVFEKDATYVKVYEDTRGWAND